MSVHILDAMAREGFEQVIALSDRRSGLRAFLGIHDTTAGPAFGGIRRWSYLDEKQALLDCLRLSRAMTHKCALLELPAGGGKLVVLDRPEMDRVEAYRHIGQCVEELGGRFYTGPDVGTGRDDLACVAERTAYVTRPDEDGPGDLSAATCEGVFAGLAAGLRHLDGEEDWARRVVVIQGLGGIGERLAERLARRGARVIGSDVDANRAAEVGGRLGIEIVDSSGEYDLECDVFAPCALGGILHDLTVKRLRARMVVGGANNVLAKGFHADQLHERGILYLPDFAVNAGALILGSTFHLEARREPLESIGRRVGDLVTHVLELGAAQDEPPARVAMREAERRIAARRLARDHAPSVSARACEVRP